jgi:hypothetical protein
MAKATKEKSPEKRLKKKKKKVSSASRQSDGPETKTTTKASSKASGKATTKPATKPATKATTKASGKASGSSKVKTKGKAKAKGKEDDAKGSKRKLGLRGAAPWAARHAAKHAAEARARAAEPAPPGSARATIRVPQGAEEIKQKIGELHNQTTKIRTLRKRMEKGFFDIGQVLAEIQEQELFQAKGFGSFEAFLERETDLGKQTSLKLVKLSKVFQKEAALDYGMERCIAALAALEGEAAPKTAAPSSPGPSTLPLPLKPPMRVVNT